MLSNAIQQRFFKFGMTPLKALLQKFVREDILRLQNDRGHFTKHQTKRPSGDRWGEMWSTKAFCQDSGKLGVGNTLRRHQVEGAVCRCRCCGMLNKSNDVVQMDPAHALGAFAKGSAETEAINGQEPIECASIWREDDAKAHHHMTG